MLQDDDPWAVLFEEASNTIVEAERRADRGDNDGALKAVIRSVQLLISEGSILLDDLHGPSDKAPSAAINGEPAGLLGLLWHYAGQVGDAADAGLRWNEYAQLPPLYVDGEPEYPLEILVACRGCGRPSLAYGQIEADKSLSVMTTGSHPEPRKEKCGEKFPALIFAFREIRGRVT